MAGPRSFRVRYIIDNPMLNQAGPSPRAKAAIRLAELRRRGYRRVVVAGQSRGWWNSLMVLDTPGLVDAAIAIAPAAHGDLGSPNHPRQLDDLRAIVAAAQAGWARVALANVRDDPQDAEPEARGALFRQLGARAGGFLFRDRPEGLSGHGAGASTAFSERFGACLLRFVTESGTCRAGHAGTVPACPGRLDMVSCPPITCR